MNRLPDRIRQEISCCIRKEDRNVREYIGVYIQIILHIIGNSYLKIDFFRN